MGRPVLYAGEIKRMEYAENLVAAYQGRQRSENWAGWAEHNPYWSRELNRLAREANER